MSDFISRLHGLLNSNQTWYRIYLARGRAVKASQPVPEFTSVAITVAWFKETFKLL